MKRFILSSFLAAATFATTTPASAQDPRTDDTLTQLYVTQPANNIQELVGCAVRNDGAVLVSVPRPMRSGGKTFKAPKTSDYGNQFFVICWHGKKNTDPDYSAWTQGIPRVYLGKKQIKVHCNYTNAKITCDLEVEDFWNGSTTSASSGSGSSSSSGSSSGSGSSGSSANSGSSSSGSNSGGSASSGGGGTLTLGGNGSSGGSRSTTITRPSGSSTGSSRTDSGVSGSRSNTGSSSNSGSGSSGSRNSDANTTTGGDQQGSGQVDEAVQEATVEKKVRFNNTSKKKTECELKKKGKVVAKVEQKAKSNTVHKVKVPLKSKLDMTCKSGSKSKTFNNMIDTSKLDGAFIELECKSDLKCEASEEALSALDENIGAASDSMADEGNGKTITWFMKNEHSKAVECNLQTNTNSTLSTFDLPGKTWSGSTPVIGKGEITFTLPNDPAIEKLFVRCDDKKAGGNASGEQYVQAASLRDDSKSRMEVSINSNINISAIQVK